MTGKYLLYLMMISLLSSCTLHLPFDKVHTGYDDFKKEKIHYYRYSGKARSLLFKRGGYDVNLDFKQIEAENHTKNKMTLFLNLTPEKNISDSVYVKIKEHIFPLKVSNLFKSAIEQSSTEVETKVENEKDKEAKDEDKQIISTLQSTNTYRYIHASLFFILPDKMIKALKNSDDFALRFYVDDQPYTIKINRGKLNKVKQVFGINEVAD